MEYLGIFLILVLFKAPFTTVLNSLASMFTEDAKKT